MILDGDRRWFMAQHLTRTISPQWARFFRNEAKDRWKLDPDRTAQLNGDWDQLIDLLCDHYDFTIRRAQTEAEDFYSEFDRRVQETNRTGTHAADRVGVPQTGSTFSEMHTAA